MRLEQHLPETVAYAHDVSISPFPYDLTAESVDEVGSLVGRAGNVYTVQLDNGIPWQDADSGSEFDAGVSEEWQRHKDYIQPGQQVYLAIAPLQDDRMSWATGFDGADAPRWATWPDLDLERLSAAYLNYVERAVEYFGPTYLNIGVEAGDLAHNDPELWLTLASVLEQTYRQIKAEQPAVQVGVSWSLPLLMQVPVLERSDTLIAALDYVGISFYPYLDQFYSKIGGVSLAEAPDQWRMPYRWLRENIDKPVAICETGYSSAAIRLDDFDLDIDGDPALQSQYVDELAAIAGRDGYLFTVFFLAVDYDALTSKLGLPAMELWQNTGFFDAQLQPKPAWQSYIRSWLGQT
ncbi:MAG: hypothetical protein ACK5H2_02145 [Beutenbergiaceae bacterium]